MEEAKAESAVVVREVSVVVQGRESGVLRMWPRAVRHLHEDTVSRLMLSRQIHSADLIHYYRPKKARKEKEFDPELVKRVEERLARFSIGETPTTLTAAA